MVGSPSTHAARGKYTVVVPMKGGGWRQFHVTDDAAEATRVQATQPGSRLYGPDRKLYTPSPAPPPDAPAADGGEGEIDQLERLSSLGTSRFLTPSERVPTPSDPPAPAAKKPAMRAKVQVLMDDELRGQITALAARPDICGRFALDLAELGRRLFTLAVSSPEVQAMLAKQTQR